MCTQLTPFKTWYDLLFINVYPIDSFQDHMTWFLHCVPKWLLSRPFDLILSMCTKIDSLSGPYDLIFTLCTYFLSMCTQLIPFKTIWPDLYPIDFFLDHMTELIPLKTIWPNFLSMCTQLTPFKTIWPNFINVYQSVPNWLLSRPYDLIFTLCTYFSSMCTQLTPFKTIWPDFCIVYPNDSFQDHLTEFYQCVPNWLLSRPYDLIFTLCTQNDSFQNHLT